MAVNGEDTFATYHPLVNFLFYIGAFVGGMFFLHPAFVLCAVLLCGAALPECAGAMLPWQFLSGLLPLFIFLTVVNPVFNTYGDRVLFVWHIGSLTAGAPVYHGGTFRTVWRLAGCSSRCCSRSASDNEEMTEDKFLYLFGRFFSVGFPRPDDGTAARAELPEEGRANSLPHERASEKAQKKAVHPKKSDMA